MDRHRRREGVRELLYKVLAILYRYSERLAVIEHPRSMKMRSIDIAVALRDGKRLIVKVAYDLDEIPRSEIHELLTISQLLGLSPLIIAAEKSGEPLLEGVVYEKGGIHAVSPETLENVLSGVEQVYIKVEKSAFTVSIDGEAMRRRRLELNLSLGDLATMLGVSRRTVYEYEKGSMEPSLEKAEILIKVLGEEIAKPIDLFALNRERPPKSAPFDTIIEQMLATRLEERGYRLAHVKRTAMDIAASMGDGRSSLNTRPVARASQRKCTT